MQEKKNTPITIQKEGVFINLNVGLFFNKSLKYNTEKISKKKLDIIWIYNPVLVDAIINNKNNWNKIDINTIAQMRCVINFLKGCEVKNKQIIKY